MAASVVSEAVHHALTSPSPKLEYLLGTHGSILRFLRATPAWFLDWYLEKLLWPGPNVKVSDLPQK